MNNRILGSLIVLIMILVLVSDLKSQGEDNLEIYNKRMVTAHKVNYDSLEYFGKQLIVTLKNQEIIEGEFYKTEDSVLVLQMVKFEENDTIPKYFQYSVHLEEIKEVIIINESKVLTSLGNGFLSGAGIGAIIGLASGNSDRGIVNVTAGEKALLLGGMLGAVGAIIGAVVGVGSAVDETININSLEELKHLDLRSRLPMNSSTIKSRQANLNKIDKKKGDKKFETSFFLATTSSGPASNIEEQMRKNGLDKARFGSLSGSGGTTHPVSNTGFGELGAPWMASFKFDYLKNYMFGAFYSGNPIGITTGWDSKNFISLSYSVETIAAMSWYKYNNVSIGLGPAIYFTDLYEETFYSNRNQKYNKTKLGFVLEAGITYPAQTALFINIITQFRFVGDVKVGPFSNIYYEYDEIKSTLPAFNINYNHFFFGFGAGFRI